MSGLSRVKKKKIASTAYVFLSLSIVSFSLLLFSTRSFIFNIRDTGLSAFSGIRGGIYSISSFFSQTVMSISELAQLRKQYAELQDRLIRYERLEKTVSQIRQENARLKKELGFTQEIAWQHIPAEITGRDPDNVFSQFVINKGRLHGVEKDMAVIAFQDGKQALVGKVVQASQVESLVMPLYDDHAFVSARLEASRYEGIVEGQGGMGRPLRMRAISKRAVNEAAQGDLVITSGQGGVYPPGIIIGRIQNILLEEYKTSIELDLECSINFSKLEYVFVIKNTSKELDQ